MVRPPEENVKKPQVTSKSTSPAEGIEIYPIYRAEQALQGALRDANYHNPISS